MKKFDGIPNTLKGSKLTLQRETHFKHYTLGFLIQIKFYISAIVIILSLQKNLQVSLFYQNIETDKNTIILLS